VIEDPAGVAMVEQAGRAAFPGFQLRILAETTSTQDVVRAAARAGAAPGFCCVAGSQTAGRGRQDRAWTAPPQTALLLSTLLRLDTPSPGWVSIAAGLALRAAIETTSGCRCRLKWPNDLLVGGAKLAGILCEVEAGAPPPGTSVAVGMGVNLTVPSFAAGIHGISLHQVVETPPSASRLLAALLEELAARLAFLDRAAGSLREEWMRHAASIGEVVTATSPAGTVTGIAEGLDDDGALVLRGPNGPVRVLAGDVHLGG
jgi:BirA family transcriptional regulator, biotin operon repressor / biotin---[acetyl-CoA-carboxylase] ligase